MENVYPAVLWTRAKDLTEEMETRRWVTRRNGDGRDTMIWTDLGIFDNAKEIIYID